MGLDLELAVEFVVAIRRFTLEQFWLQQPNYELRRSPDFAAWGFGAGERSATYPEGDLGGQGLEADAGDEILCCAQEWRSGPCCG